VRRTRGAMSGLLTGLLTTVGLASAALILAGCAGRVVSLDRGAHGNLHAEVARGPARANADDGAPAIVLIERGGVRAVDPDRGVEHWWKPLHVVGHPVASHDTVYLPIRGHRLAALDRRSGVIRWSTRLPGEALTGLAVADGVVIAVVVDGSDKSRSRVVALSTEDAVLRWQRRSDGRFGVPAARKRVVIVPLGEDAVREVVAFRLASGREVARVELPTGQGTAAKTASPPTLEWLTDQDDALVLGGGNRFVNLLSATGGETPAPQRIDTGFGWLFQPIEGLDPGYDDSERLRLWVRFIVSGDAPRGAVMLARRAVVSMRIAPDGRPMRARWVHHAEDAREMVAMNVGAHLVTVVREDGSIVKLDAHTGEVLKRWAGKRPTRGALLVGMNRGAPPPKAAAPDPAVVRDQLVGLLEDEDPRLLPAQVLAADLLWRSDDVDARARVEQLATGTLAVGTGDAAAQLRAHALDLLAEPWGQADASELSARLAALSDRPSYLADRSLELAPIARAAVHSGNAEMVPHLVDHLLHPATAASDLVEVARALATLGGPDANAGLATFVSRYHADPDVVYESRALHVAIDHLAGQSDAGEHDAKPGAQALVTAMEDPFTEPHLRAYIAARLGFEAPAAAASVASESVAKARAPKEQPRDAGRIPPVLEEVHPSGL